MVIQPVRCAPHELMTALQSNRACRGDSFHGHTYPLFDPQRKDGSETEPDADLQPLREMINHLDRPAFRNLGVFPFEESSVDRASMALPVTFSATSGVTSKARTAVTELATPKPLSPASKGLSVAPWEREFV